MKLCFGNREVESMGHTVARIKLYSPHDLSKSIDIELLVDTGSTYTWIKREKLEKIGIKP